MKGCVLLLPLAHDNRANNMKEWRIANPGTWHILHNGGTKASQYSLIVPVRSSDTLPLCRNQDKRMNAQNSLTPI